MLPKDSGVDNIWVWKILGSKNIGVRFNGLVLWFRAALDQSVVESPSNLVLLVLLILLVGGGFLHNPVTVWIHPASWNLPDNVICHDVMCHDVICHHVICHQVICHDIMSHDIRCHDIIYFEVIMS